VSDAHFRALARAASARYRPGDRFARHFAYGKLTRDPAFRALLERGLIERGHRLLDLGCGQGVLEALLLAARERHTAGDWPGGWPPPPAFETMHGIDLAARDIERAREACGAAATFVHGDIRDADLGKACTVVILDVLHYIDYAAQDGVLARVRAALARGGVLLLRVGDRSRTARFFFTDLVDRIVMRLRGHRLERVYCRAASEWRDRLAALGFRVEALPMSAGTPFANVLLVARYDSPEPSPRHA
jgi:SAM-dependent methyltransferase